MLVKRRAMEEKFKPIIDELNKHTKNKATMASLCHAAACIKFLFGKLPEYAIGRTVAHVIKCGTRRIKISSDHKELELAGYEVTSRTKTERFVYNDTEDHALCRNAPAGNEEEEEE